LPPPGRQIKNDRQGSSITAKISLDPCQSRRSHIMDNCVTVVNNRDQGPSCLVQGRTFTAKPSRHKAGRFIFGYTDHYGQHITVRCSGAVELYRCLVALRKGGLLPLDAGGAA
jgi:hypothetical protein